MKLDAKLEELLNTNNYELINKDGWNYLINDDNIKYKYLSDDVIEFKLIDNLFEHNILRYNFNNNEFSIAQKVNVSHPVCGLYMVPDDSDEIFSIFPNLHLLNRKNTISYMNDLYSGIIFYPNGDWEGTFDVDVNDRISYIGGVYQHQIVESNENGHVSSNSEIITKKFTNYQEFEAYLFQLESVESFSDSVGSVVNLLRDYHK